MRSVRNWLLALAAALVGAAALRRAPKRFSRRMRIVMGSAASLVLASIFTLPVTAANATGSGCVGGVHDFSECTTVNGSGLHVTSIVGSLLINNPTKAPLLVFIEI